MSAHSLLGYRGRIHIVHHSPPVGTLPMHLVLPEKNDAPLILDNVLAIWGQGLRRKRTNCCWLAGEERGCVLPSYSPAPHTDLACCLLLSSLLPAQAPTLPSFITFNHFVSVSSIPLYYQMWLFLLFMVIDPMVNEQDIYTLLAKNCYLLTKTAFLIHILCWYNICDQNNKISTDIM